MAQTKADIEIDVYCLVPGVSQTELPLVAVDIAEGKILIDKRLGDVPSRQCAAVREFAQDFKGIKCQVDGF